MAVNLTTNLSLNTTAAQQRLAAVYAQANGLFGKKGVGLNVNVKNTGLPLGIISRDVTQFDKSLEAATARIIAFTSTISIIYGVGRAIKRLVVDAIEVEKAMTGIQSILGATSADLKAFTNDLFELANKTGVGFFDAAAAAEEFARQGLSLSKTLTATQAALGVVRTSGGDIKQVIEGITATVNAFEDSVTFAQVADKLAALDKSFSTSASGLIEGFKRVASVASEAGFSVDELGAAFASVKQISGRSEAVIGNGFKTIITNLQNSGIQERLEAIGVATKNAAGEFRPVIDVVRDLSAAFDTLSDSARADLSQKIAGKFQINTFKTLIQAVKSGGQYERGLEISRGADGDIAKRIETLNDTTATRIQQLQNNITNLRATLGDVVGKQFVDTFLERANEFVSIIKNVFEEDNSIGQALGSSIVTTLKGPILALAAVTAVNLFKKIAVQSGGVLKSIIGIGGESKRYLDLINLQNQALQKQNALVAAQKADRSRISAGILPRNEFKKEFLGKLQSGNATGALALLKKQTDNIKNLRDLTQSQRAQNALNLAEQKKLDDQVKKQKLADKTKNFIGGAGIAASFAGGAIGGAIGGREGERISSISSTAGIVAVLAAMGPLAAAIGGVIGVFEILKELTKDVNGNLEENAKKGVEEIARLDKRDAQEEAYISALKNYEEIINSGSSIEIEKAGFALQEAAESLSGASRNLLEARPITIDQSRQFAIEPIITPGPEPIIPKLAQPAAPNVNVEPPRAETPNVFIEAPNVAVNSAAPNIAAPNIPKIEAPILENNITVPVPKVEVNLPPQIVEKSIIEGTTTVVKPVVDIPRQAQAQAQSPVAAPAPTPEDLSYSRAFAEASRKSLDQIRQANVESISRQKAASLSRQELKALSDSIYTGFVNQNLGIFRDDPFTEQFVNKKAAGRTESEPLVKSLVQSIDLNSIGKKTFEGIEKSLSDFIQSGDSSGIVRAVEQLISDPAARDTVDKFANGFKNGREDLSRYVAEQLIATKVMRDAAKASGSFQQNLSKANKSFDTLLKSVFFEKAKEKEKVISGFRAESSGIGRAIQNTSLTPEAQAGLEFQKALLDAQTDSLSKINDIEAEYNQKIYERLKGVTGAENISRAAVVSSKIASGELSGAALDAEVKRLVGGFVGTSESLNNFSEDLVLAQQKRRDVLEQELRSAKDLSDAFESSAESIRKAKLGNLFGDLSKPIQETVDKVTAAIRANRELNSIRAGLKPNEKQLSPDPVVRAEGAREAAMTRAELSRIVIEGVEAAKEAGIETPGINRVDIGSAYKDRLSSANLEVGLGSIKELLAPLNLRKEDKEKADILVTSGDTEGLKKLISDLFSSGRIGRDINPTIRDRKAQGPPDIRGDSNISAIFNFIKDFEARTASLDEAAAERTDQLSPFDNLATVTGTLNGTNAVLSERIAQLTAEISEMKKISSSALGEAKPAPLPKDIKVASDRMLAMEDLRRRIEQNLVEQKAEQTNRTSMAEKTAEFGQGLSKVGDVKYGFLSKLDRGLESSGLVGPLTDLNAILVSLVGQTYDFSKNVNPRSAAYRDDAKELNDSGSLQSIKTFIQQYLKNQTGDTDQGLNKALVKAFGREKASVVIQSGALDPIRGDRRPDVSRSEERTRALQEENKILNDKLREIQEKTDKENPEIKNLGASIEKLSTVLSTSANEINGNFNVNVNGAMAENVREILRSDFGKLFENAYAEATGKKPRTIPRSIA